MVHKALDTPPMPTGTINYYDQGGLSTLDVIRAKLSPEQYKGFLLGNVIKYTLRMNWKGNGKQDSLKASDYAGWLKEEMNK